MANIPNGGESNYPRAQMGLLYAPSAKLQLLVDGYFGLTRVFLLAIGLWILAVIIAIALGQAVGGLVGPITYYALAVVNLVVIVRMSYITSKKITEAMNAPNSTAGLYTVLIVVLGIIGFAIVQTIAGSEMKKYGLKTGLLFTKKKADAFINQYKLRETEVLATFNAAGPIKSNEPVAEL